MWLFTVHGFYSIVKKDHVYHLRSREKQDLENLRRMVPSLPKVQDSFKGSDYPFRLILREDEKDSVMFVLAKTIDYPNFKSAVGTRADQREKPEKYHEVWGVMARD